MHKFHSQLSRVLITVLAAGIFWGCSAEAKKSRLTNRAERYFQAGEYEKAKIEYLNLLRLDPQNAKVYKQIGLIWLEQGVPLRAAPYLVEARRLAPNDLAIRTKLASLLVSVGHLAEEGSQQDEIANSEGDKNFDDGFGEELPSKMRFFTDKHDEIALGMVDQMNVVLGPANFEAMTAQPSRDTLLVGGADERIYEITRRGRLVRVIDVSEIRGLRRISGLTIAPATNGSDRLNYWIVDRGIDNRSHRHENDGKLWEIAIAP